MTQRTRKTHTRTAFGERLYAARTRAELTQDELGKQLGMSQRGIANWEIRPNSSPSAEQLAQLAQILGVSVEELVLGTPEQIRKKPGPKSRLERQLDAVKTLTPKDQQLVSRFLDMLIAGKGS